MMASRGMGAIAPSKMPKGKRKARRDNTDFTQYADGGAVGLLIASLRRKYAQMLLSHYFIKNSIHNVVLLEDHA